MVVVHPPHTSLAIMRVLLRKRLRHDFFFLPFSIPMLLSESADNLLAEPLFGDNNFLYHLGFLYSVEAGLLSALFKDNVLGKSLFSFSNGWFTDKFNIDDATLGCDLNFGDGGQNGLSVLGVVGDDIFGAFGSFDELLVGFCNFGEDEFSLRLRGNGCGVGDSDDESTEAFCGCGGCSDVAIDGDGASVSVIVIFGIDVRFITVDDGLFTDFTSCSQK